MAFFTASAHGKGRSDSVGEAVKRAAYLDSLRKLVEGHILTAADLTNFVNKKMEKILAVLVPETEIQDLVEQLLKERFANAVPLQGITSYHSIVPLSKNAVIVKRYSTSASQERIQLRHEVPSTVKNLEGGYATIIQGNNWHLCKITSTNEITAEVTAHVMVQARRRFKMETENAQVTVKLENILLLLTPSFDGITYGMSNIHRKKTAEIFAEKLPSKHILTAPLTNGSFLK